MADNRFSCAPRASGGDTVSIETNRILDACRDRDCYENLRVYLTDCGNETLEHCGSIRAKYAEILWSNIAIDPIRFNRGFYSVTVRFFIKVVFEACIGGGRSQEIEGIVIPEKRVILYGGDCNVSVFRSSEQTGGFCGCPEPCFGTRSTPTAVVEVVDPILLGSKILEKACDCNCCCCCCENDLPHHLVEVFDSPLCFDDERARRFLAVSVGIFSVIRIVRPAQYLIQATEYAIPEKECLSVEEDDPCCVFRNMPFPSGEFSTGTGGSCKGEKHEPLDRLGGGRCGC